ncbi:MAG: hypothetical protein F4W95_09140 [Chloroflexi bacterium]|nr:hypothetical protein [Chloroflexota bacterium]MYD48634.1 hypothetical protein [Chloroflexota bacterium]
MSANPLWTATYRVGEPDLEDMTLEAADLPDDLRGYQLARSGPLDNAEMAENGFKGSTADRFRNAGRIGGFMREFVPTSDVSPASGVNFVGATVVHLFESPDQVSGWMSDVFVKDFEDNVGESVGSGQQLISVNRLDVEGFYDEAVGLHVLQGGPAGLLSSTVIDFRVGRLLGVAFVGAIGEHRRTTLASELALALEKRMVQVALGV